MISEKKERALGSSGSSNTAGKKRESRIRQYSWRWWSSQLLNAAVQKNHQIFITKITILLKTDVYILKGKLRLCVEYILCRSSAPVTHGQGCKSNKQHFKSGRERNARLMLKITKKKSQWMDLPEGKEMIIMKKQPKQKEIFNRLHL